METETVRRWCIEMAMRLLLSNKAESSLTTKDVVDVAKELEDYITPQETKNLLSVG